MMSQIVITGTGVISAIGNDKAETLHSLQNGISGIGKMTHLKSEHTEFPVGEVSLSDTELCQRLDISTETPTTRTFLLGAMAMKEALDEAHLIGETDKNIAFVNGTTVGGMDKTERYYADFLTRKKHLEYLKTHDCGACTNMIADYFGIFSSATTISTACSSAANAIIFGANLIKSGRADIVVVGGCECLTVFHLNGFNSLMILDREECRPFDATRAGLNLGEGAAYLVMESEESAKERGANIVARLVGYGNACDAHHQTASSADGKGALLAMTKALEMAQLAPSDISYINAHGTGTPNNDASETTAIMQLFGENVPPVSSTKAMTGHTTSASGSIEAVFCIMTLQHQFLPINRNWHEKIENGFVPVTNSVPKAPLRYALCNAFGFGGNDSAMVFSFKEERGKRREDSKEEREERREEREYHNSTRQERSMFNVQRSTLQVLAASQISLQQPLSEQWMQEAVEYDVPFSRAIDPNFREFINPMEARRMGKLLKRALATAKSVIKTTGIEHPDAIITGTALGCLENTQLFLDQLIMEGEQLLKPTYFMNSTHNTICSLIGINTKSNGYNCTFSHRNISFESALLDAAMQMQLNEISNALVCAADEMTPSCFELLKLAESEKQKTQNRTQGEATVAMMLVKDVPEGVTPLATISYINILHKPQISVLKAILEALNDDNLDGENVVWDTECPSSMRSLPNFGSNSGTLIYAASHLISAGKYSSVTIINRDCPADIAIIKLERTRKDDVICD